VTFLFTDVEGSTRLLHELGAEQYAAALHEHRRVLRECFGRHEGTEVDTQGDAFFVAFPSAEAAVAAAYDAQEELAAGPIVVRMGLHTGRPHVTGDGYVGEDVHLGARVAAAGHGGQVLLTAATRELVAAEVTDLGEHRLKDFDAALAIFQLGDERFPPLKTISNTNLPHPASSFVGREREVGEVVTALHGARLVTLTGPGGSGKTRLSIEAAAELVGDFKAGVFWVGLATLHDPSLVVDTIAKSLGAKGGLAEHVGDREMLLLLDNFEQVVEAAPELSQVLEACPNLRLLVTSRELLRIQGEVEYPVLPLAEPDAVELFCTRSRLDPDDAVAELCRRLDNLPLAVELAAARTAVLSPAQILDRLSRRLDLLKGGRDVDARQQTLRATIEWSHELLSEEERELFAGLAVFAGGCTVEAAEAVCGADLDTLQGLVEKSLVRHTEGRFWMLETIREYAAERLEASEEGDAIPRRLAEWLIDMAASANFSLESEGVERYDLVVPELPNLRDVMQWAIEEDPELGARLLLSIEQFWVFTSPFEARQWLKELLARGPYADTEQAKLLAIYGGLTFIVGEVEEGGRYHREATEIFRRLDDDRRLSLMLARLGVDANIRGDQKRARELCDEALALARPLGFRKAIAQALLALAYVERAEGRPAESVRLADEAADRAKEIGWGWWEAGSLIHATDSAFEVYGPLGDGGRARRCLAAAHAIGDRAHSVYALAYLAWAAAEAKDATRAGRLWGAIEGEMERGPIGQWEREYEDYAQHLLAVAGPEFEEGRAEGRRLTLDEAAAEALSVDSPS